MRMRTRSPRRLRPSVLTLEDRATPSTFQYTLVNDWGAGLQAAVTLGNDEAAAIDGWRLEFDFAGQITQAWDAEVQSRAGNHYVVVDAGYDARIAPARPSGSGSSPRRGTSPPPPTSS